MLEDLSVNDLTRIAAAGGGFQLAVTKFTSDDLTRIAAAAAQSGALITFTSIANLGVDDLVRIAAAGQTCVSFAD